jgi:hypothetical protein
MKNTILNYIQNELKASPFVVIANWHEKQIGEFFKEIENYCFGIGEFSFSYTYEGDLYTVTHRTNGLRHEAFSIKIADVKKF